MVTFGVRKCHDMEEKRWLDCNGSVEFSCLFCIVYCGDMSARVYLPVSVCSSFTRIMLKELGFGVLVEKLVFNLTKDNLVLFVFLWYTNKT